MADSKRIFVTGASGFIAKHVVLKFLNAGHEVTGSLRSPRREGEVRAAVAPHLTDPAAAERLGFAHLDLLSDDGWAKALEGHEVLVHTASPFPIAQPKNEEELIRPAVDGTLRALKAAKAVGIGRVVLTSSAVAIMSGTDRDGPCTEDDWSRLDHPAMSAYGRSKTLAERAAWDFVQDEAPEMALTTINPVVVTGPPLDDQYGSSVSVVQRILSGKDPMVPRIGFPVVDVRDVAEMHLRAAERPETAGMRFLAADRALWFSQMAEVLRAAYPERRRIPHRTAPNFLIRALSLFDPEIRAILPNLGRLEEVSNARAREVMGMTFIDAAQSLRDTAAFLIDHRLV